MSKNIVFKFLILIILSSCDNGFNYDPTVTYPSLNVGDYWIDKFDQRGLQNAKIMGDRLFCNTINISEGQNFLYCLNLSDGKVLWKVPVEGYASQQVEIFNNYLYYSTFVGQIYKISIEGELLWEIKSPYSYAGHFVNPSNGNLIVNSVTNGAYEYGSEIGNELYHYHFKSKSGICHLTDPLFHENLIIFGNVEVDSISGQEGFVALQYVNKKTEWSHPLASSVYRNKDWGLLKIDKYVLTRDEANILHCLDAENGKEVWTKDLVDERTNDKWIFRFKAESHNLVYHKGQKTAIDVKTGIETEHYEQGVLKEYLIKKDDEIFSVQISDEVQIDGIEIKIVKK